MVIVTLCVVLGGTGNGFVCKKTVTTNGNEVKVTAKVKFPSNGFETLIDYEMVLTYNTNKSDQEIINLLNEQLNRKDIHEGTNELGLTSYGTDTVVKKNGNVVTITYHSSNYNTMEKLTASDKKEFKKKFEEQGMKCR